MAATPQGPRPASLCLFPTARRMSPAVLRSWCLISGMSTCAFCLMPMHTTFLTPPSGRRQVSY
jgi:hypothetical protein